MGIGSMSMLGMIAILFAFNIIFHLGFASATSLANVFIPIVLALVMSMEASAGAGGLGFDVIGFVLIQQFAISFGFMLPVNAPQNMVAYGTGGFKPVDLLKVGVPLTIVGYALLMVFAATYWQWIGLL
jgi:di/tricarboxylate transporter